MNIHDDLAYNASHVIGTKWESDDAKADLSSSCQSFMYAD